MSTVRFAQIDGQRVEIPDGAIRWESRCDHCGEFISGPEHVSVTLRVGVGGVPVTPDPPADLHIRCVTAYEWGPAILAALRQHLAAPTGPLPGVGTDG